MKHEVLAELEMCLAHPEFEETVKELAVRGGDSDRASAKVVLLMAREYGMLPVDEEEQR